MTQVVSSIHDLETRLLSCTSSVAERMRTIHGLKSYPCPTSSAASSPTSAITPVDILGKSLQTDPSALVRHEAAYALGQTRNTQAIPVLHAVLQNKYENPMVRHECAEALGAIGTQECRQILIAFQKDEMVEVRETVEVALERIQFVDRVGIELHPQSQNHTNTDENSESRPACAQNEKVIQNHSQVFDSVDPAFAVGTDRSVDELTTILTDSSLPLYTRYEAMFALRNLSPNNPKAIHGLCSALNRDQSSALFRHEIAYVLGQIASPLSVPYLETALKDQHEHEMVRHEAAEALGAVANPQAQEILRRYLDDDKQVVRESCIVATDIAEYVNDADQLHYTDTILS